MFFFIKKGFEQLISLLYIKFNLKIFKDAIKKNIGFENI